jgi:hypothetical protein
MFGSAAAREAICRADGLKPAFEKPDRLPLRRRGEVGAVSQRLIPMDEQSGLLHLKARLLSTKQIQNCLSICRSVCLFWQYNFRKLPRSAVKFT